MTLFDALMASVTLGPYETAGGFLLVVIAEAIAETAAAVVILAALPGLARMSLHALGFRRLDFGTVGLAIAAGVLMTVLANLTAIPYGVAPDPTTGLLAYIHGNRLLLGTLFASVLVAIPFAEEVIFRVFLFNVGSRYCGPWVGAVLSSAVFGLGHYVSGTMGAVGAVAIGIAALPLCWVYFRTKNAYASMISHASYNAAMILAAALWSYR